MAFTSSKIALGPQRFLSLDDFEGDGEGIPVLLRTGKNLSDYLTRNYTNSYPTASSLEHTSLHVSCKLNTWKKPLLKIKTFKISLALIIKLEQQRWQVALPIVSFNDGNIWQDITTPDGEENTSLISGHLVHDYSPSLTPSPCLPRSRDCPGPTLEGLLASVAMADRIMCRKGMTPKLFAATSSTNSTPAPPTPTINIADNPSTTVTSPSASTYEKKNSLDPKASPFYPSTPTPSIPITTTPTLLSTLTPGCFLTLHSPNTKSETCRALGGATDNRLTTSSGNSTTTTRSVTTITPHITPTDTSLLNVPPSASSLIDVVTAIISVSTSYPTSTTSRPTTETSFSTDKNNLNPSSSPFHRVGITVSSLSNPELVSSTLKAITPAHTSSPTIYTTTTPSTTAITPSTTYDKKNTLSPKASSFYPFSSKSLGLLVNKHNRPTGAMDASPSTAYNRLTGAMGAPPKTAPIRLTGAMGAPPTTAPIRLTGAMGAPPITAPIRLSTNSTTTTPYTTTPTNITNPTYRMQLSKLTPLPRRSPSKLPPASHRPSLWKILGERGHKPLSLDFSLSSNERSPRMSRFTSTQCRSTRVSLRDRPAVQSKAHWIPRSAARRRLEWKRLNGLSSLSGFGTDYGTCNNNNKNNYNKNINKLNIYENTYVLNDSLKPHDIFFTPRLLTLDDVLYTTPSLTLKDVFYWEFKAG